MNTQTASTNIQQARNELANYPLTDVAQCLRVVARQDRGRMDRMRKHARFAPLVLWAEELVDAVAGDRFNRRHLKHELLRIESIVEARRASVRRVWLQVGVSAGILGVTTVLAYLAATI